MYDNAISNLIFQARTHTISDTSELCKHDAYQHGNQDLVRNNLRNKGPKGPNNHFVKRQNHFNKLHINKTTVLLCIKLQTKTSLLKEKRNIS